MQPGYDHIEHVFGMTATKQRLLPPSLHTECLVAVIVIRTNRYAGIGGVSEMLGWTEVQQEEKKSFAGGYENVLKVVGVVLALDAVVFLYEYITVQVQGKPNPFA